VAVAVDLGENATGLDGALMLPSARRVLVELDPNPNVRSKPVIAWMAASGCALFGTVVGNWIAVAPSADPNCEMMFCACACAAKEI
jgi:hypothetical protein